MAIQDYYGTPEGYVRFFCIMECDDLEGPGRQLMIDSLRMASGDINMAIQSVGAQNCTFTSTAISFLERLAYVGAAIFYNCPCSNARLREEQIRSYMEWLTNNLTAIREGDLELCQNQTGKSFPSVGWAEQNVTPWTENQILQNDEERNG